MKKVLSIVVGLLMMFPLVGCDKQRKEDITKTVNNYFAAIQAGDYEKAMEATNSKNDDFDDDFGLELFSKDISSAFMDDSMGEVFAEEAQKFLTYSMSKIIIDYSIEDVNSDNEKAVVTISGQYTNFDELETTDSEAEAEDYIDEYMETHQDELIALYDEQGEEAVKEKVAADIAPMFFESMKKLFDDLGRLKFNMKMRLINVDGSWLITDIIEVE